MIGARTLKFVALTQAILAFGSMDLRAAELEPDCLNEAEVREVVTNRVVIPQIQALRLARSTIGGDAIRASLCRTEGGLIYVITVLARDGKLERVRIKGETGEYLPAKKE
jgi:uncharacterized membrane protein YkoI